MKVTVYKLEHDYRGGLLFALTDEAGNILGEAELYNELVAKGEEPPDDWDNDWIYRHPIFLGEYEIPDKLLSQLQDQGDGIVGEMHCE